LSKSYTGEEPKNWASYCSITGVTINKPGYKKQSELTLDLFDSHIMNQIKDSLQV
jgi:hypothetical protein